MTPAFGGRGFSFFGPRAFGECALHFEFAELHGGRPQGLVGVGNRAGAQAVALMAMI